MIKDMSASFSKEGEDTLIVDVQEDVYSIDVIFKTCYLFTDRAYLLLRRRQPGVISVHITRKEPSISPEELGGEFCNVLIDHKVRETVSKEFGRIREMVVAQAFAEGNLFEERKKSPRKSDYGQDPLNIGDYHEPKKSD